MALALTLTFATSPRIAGPILDGPGEPVGLGAGHDHLGDSLLGSSPPHSLKKLALCQDKAQINSRRTHVLEPVEEAVNYELDRRRSERQSGLPPAL